MIETYTARPPLRGCAHCFTILVKSLKKLEKGLDDQLCLRDCHVQPDESSLEALAEMRVFLERRPRAV